MLQILSFYEDKMIKGLFLVFLLLAVASTKAAVDEKGEKELNNLSTKVLTTHISTHLLY